MQNITTVLENPTEIRQLKDDEELRLVVAASGDYGQIWHRDSYTKKEFSDSAEWSRGLYRAVYIFTPLVAHSWEELLVAYARESQRLGKVSVANTGRGTVTSFEV